MADFARERRTRTACGDGDLQAAALDHRRRDKGAQPRYVGDIDGDAPFAGFRRDRARHNFIAGGLEGEPRSDEVALKIFARMVTDCRTTNHRGKTGSHHWTDKDDDRTGLD